MPLPPLTPLRSGDALRSVRPACVACVLRPFCMPAGPGQLRASGFAQHRVRRGTALYQQGTNVEELWVVCHGGVKLVHSDPQGHEDVLAICGPGTVFGHDEIVEGTHRTTAVAVQDGVVASLRRSLALTRMEQDAAFARQLYVALAGWSAQLVRRAAETGRGASRQRIARLLLRLADQFGAPTPEGMRTTIFLQRREIAGLIGSEPETVTRLLGRLIEDGVVRELRRGEFLLLDPARLHRMAHV